MLEPNACQQGDRLEPRHLQGGELFYVFNVVDVGRRKAAGQICVSKSARVDLHRTDGDLRLARGPGTAAAHTTSRRWPARRRRPGLVARACLANGPIPTTIPLTSAVAHRVMEQVNDTFDTRFFRTRTVRLVAGELIDRYDPLTDLPQRQPP